MQRLFLIACKSQSARTLSRSSSLFSAGSKKSVQIESSNKANIIYREYSKLPVNDLRVGMVIDAKGNFIIIILERRIYIFTN
jgi:hypothetical protein